MRTEVVVNNIMVGFIENDYFAKLAGEVALLDQEAERLLALLETAMVQASFLTEDTDAAINE